MAAIWAFPAPQNCEEAAPLAWPSLVEDCLEDRLDPELVMRWQPELLTALEELPPGSACAHPKPWGGAGDMEHRHIALSVPGMNEPGGERIKKQLEQAPGVHDVTVWLSIQQIDVDYAPSMITPAAIEEAIRYAGYEPTYIQYAQRWPG